MNISIIRPIIGVLAFFAGATLPATLRADSPAPAPQCALEQHRILAVEPYRVETPISYGSVFELRGAQLYVQAEPGLTAEWLQLVFREEVANAGNARSRACQVFEGDLRVAVMSAGPGFWVQLIARDSRSGEQLLGRARRLLK